jgi:ATP-dependent DNA helicase UvrD/PcrA
MDSLLDDLTEPQREAVTHVDGPLLVLAGAGSGKTRVITRRVAHLVLGVGIAPWQVLAITFTNKAAGEMRQRVAGLVSERQARAITVSTFHSLCARLLRRYAEHLGVPPNFSIYDSADQQKAMKQALADLEISTSNFPPGKLLHAISNAKNDLVDADAYAKAAGGFYEKTVAKVYRQYQQVLTRNHAMDFDDLLFNTVRLLRDCPDAAAELRRRYQYLLIDEYQDTNHAQFLIAHALAAEHQNLCATGDPDQSIYRWRGADIRNILEFEEHYPDAKVVRLEQNYRSTKRILATADTLIKHNRQRKHKGLWTENEEGERVRLVTCSDERHEARYVVEMFVRLARDEGFAWSDMAVFYRTNALSRVIEDTLRTAGIPYQIARGTSFYERKEIKDAVAYLRVIANPADEVNLLRVINTPARGISTTTVKSLQARAVELGSTVYATMRQPAQLTALNPRALKAVQAFAATLDGWQAATQDTAMSLRGFVEKVLRDSGLHDYYLNDKSDPDAERIANLGELVSYAQVFEDEFEPADAFDAVMETGEVVANTSGGDTSGGVGVKLAAFLEQISLVSDVDAIDAGQGAVTLMTLHAAKGLEFPAVAMIGVEDGLLPHEQASHSETEIEEERRLCFVGITRAMKRLTMSHARYRLVFGQTQPTIPSRFLNELPADQVEREDATDHGDAWSGDVGAAQRDEAAMAAVQFPPGTLVRHPMFGLGRVITVSPRGAHTKARVQFQHAGIKTLILQYAKLEKIDT